MAQNARKPEPAARAAIKAEAEGEETVTVRYEGMDLQVPADSQDWPTDAIEAFQQGQNIPGTKILLGPAQWAAFNARFPKLRQFSEMSEALAEALGFPGAARVDDHPAVAARA